MIEKVNSMPSAPSTKATADQEIKYGLRFISNFRDAAYA